MGPPARHAIAWLELLMVLAIVSLVLQLFPAAWWWLVGIVDVRQWSRWTWFVVNLAVVVLLIAGRLAPDMTEALARRRAEKAKRRQRGERKR